MKEVNKYRIDRMIAEAKHLEKKLQEKVKQFASGDFPHDEKGHATDDFLLSADLLQAKISGLYARIGELVVAQSE